MKILSITAQKPHSTGSGTYLTELVRAWDRSGYKQAVVAGIYRDDVVEFPSDVKFFPVYFSDDQNNSVSAHDCDIPFPIVGMSDVMPYKSTRYMDMTPQMVELFETAFIKQIKAAIEVLNPDIIVCHHLFLLTALVRKHFPDRTVYGICHGTCLRQVINCTELHKLVKPQIQRLNRIFALHNEQAENIVKLFEDGEDHSKIEDKICVIGSGYNNRLFNTNDRIEYKPGQPVRICYAGKMSKAKGVPELITALKKLEADPTVHTFTMTLAGGCQDNDVKTEIDALPACFSYLGQIPQTELSKMYKTNDIFVLPSYFEGLNLATIEAMASGLLPVCTDLPGMQDWINANVDNPNVHYLSMPEMLTIDTPSDEGRKCFGQELEVTLRKMIAEIANGITRCQPYTGRITWDSVADRIVKIL